MRNLSSVHLITIIENLYQRMADFIDSNFSNGLNGYMLCIEQAKPFNISEKNHHVVLTANVL